MADCLISPVQEIGKCILAQYVWHPIMYHFDYWWFFDNNIQGLSYEVRELDRQMYHLQQKIVVARLCCEAVRPEVEEWLRASIEKLEEARRILVDDNIPKACNLISRYSLGKNAKKTAEEIAELRNDGNFNMIADPAPPPAMASTPHRSTTDFESRKGIEEDIIKSLKESSVDMIVICGMRGVGKTTLTERIWRRVKDENLFDEVVMVTVSQKIDMLKIQAEIAERLKLKLDEKQMATRAAKLRTRLMDTKRKIIILDDVWESLRFEDLGIPIERNFERCKVLLTSRSRDPCKGIKNKKVFELKMLEEREAWNLFRETVGECASYAYLLPIAKEVVAECNGLPDLLVTVGMALENETEDYIWQSALSKLKKGNQDLGVYRPLESSYDSLHTELEKKFFLLCCLFPEDCNIPVQELTWYSMGLQMFDNMSIEKATNETHTLIRELKSRSLLIDGRDKLHVKMQGDTRDLAIYIGSRENNGFLKSLASIKKSSDDNCNWMSVDISNVRMEVPLVQLFPKLRLLMLLKSSSKEISDISFEGMKDLNVLSFQSTWVGSLPPTLRALKFLQTLCLVNCKVESISDIGELTSLKIFSCYECENITELPKEIGELSGLRLLELNECPKLQRIPFGIISRLVELEELKIRRSFSEWKTGEEMGNAAVTELASLTKLTCLEIEISDWNSAAQNIQLSKELVKYWIRIGDTDYYHVEERDYEKVMILNLGGAVGNWIRLLARNAEFLSLRGDGSDNINLAEMENLRNLNFSECLTVRKLVATKDGIVFPLLETLRLNRLENLEEICDVNQNVSLRSLKSIEITSCPELTSLSSVSLARSCLSQLEVLEIENCVAMEQVFSNGIKDDTYGCIEFPQLKKLRLADLPKLTAFWQGLKNIVNFPYLTEMTIRNVPDLKYSVFPLKSITIARASVLNT